MNMLKRLFDIVCSIIYERRQRLYKWTELCAALKRAGFVVVGSFSTFSGAPFDAAHSGTMVIMGERRAQTA